MGKQKVYVSISHQRYYFYPKESPWEFEIELDPYYLRVFDQLFQQIQTKELDNFWRAHTPYIQYHLDKENDELDIRNKKLYALIHEFGDDETKRFVEKLPYFS